ncbi:MAG: RnfABCDGE type electron transport complex subunit D [Gammaproteobacteria bacterium]|nr:RnfABCDGE type electron transport complex subunit D [Gammaproteobacteria bacterium]
MLLRVVRSKVSRSVPTTMLLVAVALMPAVVMQTLSFGTGVLSNIAMLVVLTVFLEVAAAVLRRRPPLAACSDGSGLVTALLLGLSLPPGIAFGPLFLAAMFAIVLAKHLYGGLGHNPFNPAMVGYAAVLVTFPALLGHWPAGADAIAAPGLRGIDALTAATPLDERRQLPMAAELGVVLALAKWDPWPWINAAYMAGGIVLVVLRAADVWLVAGFLLGLVIFAYMPFAHAEGFIFHALHGATMAGAFFIVTDPVSAPEQRAARFIYAAAIAAITVTIREVGAFPDGLAFAVLLMNAAGPALDRLVRAWSRR